MTMLDEILEFNQNFVRTKQYESFFANKYPNKKIAILSCMDTRLTELLPAALNLKNGDVKIIKNAGAVVSHPFGSVMRSLLVAVFELEVEDIIVIGHQDCGMQGLNAGRLIEKMLKRNISQDKLDMIRYCGVDLERWLKGFDNVETSVTETVSIIRNHPCIPNDIRVYGFIMDPVTGRLSPVCE